MQRRQAQKITCFFRALLIAFLELCELGTVTAMRQSLCLVLAEMGVMAVGDYGTVPTKVFGAKGCIHIAFANFFQIFLHFGDRLVQFWGERRTINSLKQKKALISLAFPMGVLMLHTRQNFIIVDAEVFYILNTAVSF